MEFPPTSPPRPLPAWRRPGVLASAAGLAVYALVLAHFLRACAGGSDASGYLNHARLLGAGKLHLAERIIPGLPAAEAPPYLYVPLGFKPAPDGNGLVPTYASGFPLLIMAASKLVGWAGGATVVLILHAVAGLLLVYALGRAMRLPAPWAMLGAIIIGTGPLYLEYSLQAMSDMPAMVWVTAAVVAAYRSHRTDGDRSYRSYGTYLWPVAAGAALSMAVLIRPNNILALAPILLALGRPSRGWVAFVAGGLPGAVFFCAHAHAAYGKIWATGYGDSWSSFSRAVVPETLLHYLHWLPVLFTPVVLLALGLPALARAAPRAAAVLGAWAVCYLAFYSAYFNTHETWWYLRFLLPAAPALIVGGLLVARRIPVPVRDGALKTLAVAAGFYAIYHSAHETARHQRVVLPLLLVLALFVVYQISMKILGRGRSICGLALALVLANAAWWNHEFDVWQTSRGEQTYPRTMAWLNSHLPPNAVLAVMQTSGAALYYTPFAFVRWDELSPKTFPAIAALARAERRPIFAVLFPFETDQALQTHLPGSWSLAGTVADVTIWRLNGQ